MVESRNKQQVSPWRWAKHTPRSYKCHNACAEIYCLSLTRLRHFTFGAAKINDVRKVGIDLYGAFQTQPRCPTIRCSRSKYSRESPWKLIADSCSILLHEHPADRIVKVCEDSKDTTLLWMQVCPLSFARLPSCSDRSCQGTSHDPIIVRTSTAPNYQIFSLLTLLQLHSTMYQGKVGSKRSDVGDSSLTCAMVRIFSHLMSRAHNLYSWRRSCTEPWKA